MTAIRIEHDEKKYLNWVQVNKSGFVLNIAESNNLDTVSCIGQRAAPLVWFVLGIHQAHSRVGPIEKSVGHLNFYISVQLNILFKRRKVIDRMVQADFCWCIV